jgi:predicted AlkP superfamily pyrophosphatase or phosphodiesterase
VSGFLLTGQRIVCLAKPHWLSSEDMQNFESLPTISAVTPTICQLMEVPYQTSAKPLDLVLSQAKRKVEKCLIYAPDALGLHLQSSLPDQFHSIGRQASVSTDVLAELPSVTPVCFGSMYTGLTPAEHGITEYAKPVLKCDTLFDFLIRAGKRVAIVAVENSSIDKIFRERAIDYFSEKYDQQVTERTFRLLQADQHDVILVYHQEYDDSLHATTPFSERAIKAAKNHFDSIQQIREAFDQAWERYDRLMVVTPDHGAHIDPETGQGDHGLATEEDRQVRHFYFFN